MSTYAIGDIQGCFSALKKLLAHIQFDGQKDTLWFTGDLVNRGPESLETLRFIKQLGHSHHTVLGNHDLHLLAIAYGVSHAQRGDTLEAILAAPDKIELIEWLRHQPLLHQDNGFVMVHAGIAPMWSIEKAAQLATEAAQALQGPSPEWLLKHMYGNQPDVWHDQLTGMERWRCILNYLTRMRFCYPDGRLELTAKGSHSTRTTLVPWFQLPRPSDENEHLIFGHWAALQGETHLPHIHALDTGCVWGQCLTALRLEDKQRFHVSCSS